MICYSKCLFASQLYYHKLLLKYLDHILFKKEFQLCIVPENNYSNSVFHESTKRKYKQPNGFTQMETSPEGFLPKAKKHIFKGPECNKI